MKLFLIHCGYYVGLYESHVNFLIAAEDADAARARVKARPEFKAQRMHVDSLQEIVSVQGHDVLLKPNPKRDGKTVTRNQKFGTRKSVEVES